MQRQRLFSPRLCTGLLGLLVISTSFGADSGQEADIFEQIAQVKTQDTARMTNNPAPKMPEITLPWDLNPQAPFKGGEKIATQAQLDAELQRMRAKYAPFMADLAPPPTSKRTKWDLVSFDWRYETPEDASDLEHVMRGKGEWKKVKIPHFGGPVNDATAYYRTEFTADHSMLSQEDLVIHFQAADYIADVYINGQHLGSHEGLFDPFELDIKPWVKAGKNVLVVKLRNEAIQMGDFMTLNPRKYGKKFAAAGGLGWDEPGKGRHNSAPGFGLYQPVWLEGRSKISIKDIFVRPIPQHNKAEVWLEVRQPPNAKVDISYSLYGQNFQAVLAQNRVEANPSAEPLEDGTVLYKFTIPFAKEQLRWWSSDEPWLYQIQLQLSQNRVVRDVRKKQFGMRTFVQSTASKPKGRFYLNGKEVRLRGANMMGNLMQCVLRGDYDQLRDDILLAKIANMNFWRMTQQPCQEEVYEYFDRLGMMAQTDFPAFVGIWREQAQEAVRQIGAMERLIRSHPCNVIISYINEPIFEFNPTGKLHMMAREELLPLFDKFDEVVWRLNPDQVIKWADGDLANLSKGYSDHHNYNLWYKGHGVNFFSQYFGAWMPSQEGWMHGCGEFGAEALDTPELMKKYYPKEWVEAAADGTWNPSRIPYAQNDRMGPDWFGYRPKTMEEWVKASRMHQQWAIRLSAEALRRDPKMNSFAVHLLIDAWPAGWMKTLVDYDRQAKPAYFAYRDALTPLAVNLRPDRFYAFSGDTVRAGVWVINDTAEVPQRAELRYQVKLGGKVIATGRTPAKIEKSAPDFQGFLDFRAPEVKKRQPLTVQLGLFDAKGALLHDTSHDVDLFPAADKPAANEKPPVGAGGHPQRLLRYPKDIVMDTATTP